MFVVWFRSGPPVPVPSWGCSEDREELAAGTALHTRHPGLVGSPAAPPLGRWAPMESYGDNFE